jgi:hypothetical protein
MTEFKLIVAGGRDFKDYPRLCAQINAMALDIYKDRAVSIVSGLAGGADALGKRFGDEHGVLVHEFPARWDDLTAPGAVIKTNSQGKPYNAKAGFDRNEDMARFADGLLAFWDGRSPGTSHMINFMTKLSKHVRVVKY